jgi:hypothetical protein
VHKKFIASCTVYHDALLHLCGELSIVKIAVKPNCINFEKLHSVDHNFPALESSNTFEASSVYLRVAE